MYSLHIYKTVLTWNLQDHTTEKLFKSTEKITEKKNITTSTDKQPSYNTCRCIHSDGTADSIDSLQKIRKTTPKKNLRNKSEVKKAEHRKKLYITSSKLLKD